MNVARGVFRLWIFVTALWIVCVGFAAYVTSSDGVDGPLAASECQTEAP
jgi:hypothetical protein